MECNKLSNTNRILEMDDLVSDLADGKVVLAIISIYNESNLILEHSFDNFEAIKNICSKWNGVIVPWLPHELSVFTIQLKGVFMTLLLTIFQHFENHPPLIYRKK